MDKKAFFNACAGFDWNFEFTDDFRVWSAANRRKAELIALTRDNAEFKAIWDAWERYEFPDMPAAPRLPSRPQLSDFNIS